MGSFYLFRIFFILVIFNPVVLEVIDLPAVTTSINGATQIGIDDYLISMPPPLYQRPVIEVVCNTTNARGLELTLVSGEIEAQRTLSPQNDTYKYEVSTIENTPTTLKYSCRLSNNRSGIFVQSTVRLEVIPFPPTTSDLRCTSSLGTHGFYNETTNLTCFKSVTPPGPFLQTPYWNDDSSVENKDINPVFAVAYTGQVFIDDTFSCHYKTRLDEDECEVVLESEDTLRVFVQPDLFPTIPTVRNINIAFNCSTSPASSNIIWRINGLRRPDLFIIKQRFGSSELVVVDAQSIRQYNISSVECVATRSGFVGSAQSVRVRPEQPATTFLTPRRDGELPSKGPLNLTAVIGGVVGVTFLIVLIVILLVAFIVYRARNTKRAEEGDSAGADTFPTGTESTLNPAYRSYDDYSRNLSSYPLPNGTESTLNPAYHSYDDGNYQL